MEVERILQKYPPLKIHAEKTLTPEGEKTCHVFVNSKGERIVPNIKVGPELHHAELFTWYERAFGRGKAGYLTHVPPISIKVRKEIGLCFVNDYHKIVSGAMPVMANGTPEQALEMIGKIREYVGKYANLYKE